MADITVLGGLTTVHDQRSAHSKILWHSPTTGFAMVWDNTGGTFVALKTTDAGSTWAEVDAAGAPAADPRSMGMAWEDENGNPFDSGVGHIFFVDNTDDDAQHVAFDSVAETWGTIETTSTGVSVAGTSSQSAVDGHAATNGDLLNVARLDQNGEVTADLWDESGSAWSTVGGSTANEPWFGASQTDNVLVVPANGGADFLVLMADESVNSLTARGYRVAADDWTASGSVGSLTEPATDYHNNYMAAVYDWINDRVIVVWQTQQGNAAGDLACATIAWDGTDVAPTVTGQADVVTNDATMMLAGLTFDPINQDVYAHYLQGTINATVNGHYKKSAAGGTLSWGSESSAYLGTDDDYRMIIGSVITTAGGRVMPTVYDDDDQLVLISDSNDLAIFNEAVAGNQPAATGALVVDEGGVEIALAGAQPAATGGLALAAAIALAGNQPAATGAQGAIAYAIALAGAQPAPSGALGLTAAIALAGSQPAATGAVVSLEAAAVAGAQPAPSGALAAVQTLAIAVAGSQPAATGAVVAVQTLAIAVAGNQPNATGAVAVEYLIALAGAQPAPSGIVAASQAAAVAGNQPAASGALTAVQQLAIALAGNQPAPSGALAAVQTLGVALGGTQPAPSGALVVDVSVAVALAGAQPAATGALGLTAAIALAGAQPASTGAVVVLVAITSTGTQPAPSGALVAVFVLAPGIPARFVQPRPRPETYLAPDDPLPEMATSSRGERYLR